MKSGKDSKEKRRRCLLSEKWRALSKRNIPVSAKTKPDVASNLPELTDNFNHARFQAVTLGPRRELTLELSPLIWIGDKGYHKSVVTVRLSGIVNFEQVKAMFAKSHHKRSELAYLRYDWQQASKRGDIYLQLEFERVEAGIAIQCSDLTVTEAPPLTD